ncbi:MAG: histidinol-phosphatase, partial [Muribaculaceae bacterium]|nr:histidinol-phosphatase [Muribaculaceae bacterium]
MKRIISTLTLVAALVLAMASHAQIRRQIHVPDIAGFTTLKCDFHLHTCFSDAAVWPDLRVEEALR